MPLILALLLFLPLPALAQQQPPDAALQAAVGSMSMLIREYEERGRQLVEAKRRIADLEALCGEPCKAEVKK